MEQTQQKWVAMWGNAVSIAEHRPESYAREITLRYPIDVPFDGSALRFTFDNFCGTEPITITGAAVAAAQPEGRPYKSLTCPIRGETSRPIKFKGMESVTIEAGASVVSDPVECSLRAGETICVSIYFRDFTLMQSAVFVSGPLSKGLFSFGDQRAAELLPMETTKTTSWFYFLSNVDILTSADKRAVVCYGDSITAQDWPDYLKLRLKEQGWTDTAVIRRAASGTRVLREYSCITYDSYGLKGERRFHHELPTAGADTLIIQQGINDIIHPVGYEVNVFRPMSDLPTAEELIEGLRWYVREAHKLGYRVYLGTLLPIKGWRTDAPFREELRCAVNDWMRSTDEAEGCIDFDLALRDPNCPAAFAPGYDSGDHLHPSAKAYAAMAEAVPESLLR